MMSGASRMNEDKRRKSSNLGNLAREMFGEVSVYTFIRGLGWSIVALLATSYVFLLLASIHSLFALLPASVWTLVYLVSFTMGVIYETKDLSYLAYTHGLASSWCSDTLWSVSVVLIFVLLNTWPAIPLILAMQFFPHYIPIFLGIGIAQPSGFLAILALILLINSL